ncbi:Gfo/Idh/MocA family oxidoreductase [Bacillaceae bacterium SIJ1]|uniref:Gfo/Idh/MocA family protein n=1 Tax=Litoribacterium kuwaitense TaxID=1398745 RepID=UPI0013EA9CF9|nr:Gfo/Idh/MocA family oxidoreductase [Litoribacterium kuwaitense]NGP44500.1 Gfo/Idh/MocA family oxidoreductase [Litoribacterium kuwaitense]
MTVEKLRVGIVGSGGIAKAAHIPNYKKLEDAVVLAAVSDVAIERAEEVKEEFGFEVAYSDYEEMFQKANLDIVSICTPNKFHAPIAVAALKAGIHVLCEKPPAMTVEEAEQMKQAAEDAGKILAYGFHFRQQPQTQLLKKYILNGDLGRVYASNAIALRRRGIPGWGVFTNKELQGGGPLIDIGVHMLDTALYLMGYPEPSVVMGATYAEIGTRQGPGLMGAWDWENFTVEDMARGMIRFKDGGSLVVESSFAANIEKNETMNVKVMGSHGGADLFPLHIFQEKHGSLTDTKPAYLQEINPYEEQIRLYVESIQNGSLSDKLCSAEQGVIVQKIINGLYQSDETGVPVQF